MPRENVNLENVRIIFRNFEGRPSKYNKKGDRNFAAILDEEQVEIARAAGLNVRCRESKDEGQPPTYTLAVSLNYDNYPPNIYTVVTTQRDGGVRHKKLRMDADTVGMLDYADILGCDITIRPYHWRTEDGRSGVKAYVKNMYVNIEEDPFFSKYEDDANGSEEDVPF